MHVRHCPRCGADYRPEIERCAECDLPLQDRHDEDDPRFRPAGGMAEDRERVRVRVEGDVHTLYFARDLQGLVPLRERLEDAGIRCQIASLPEPGCSGRPTIRYELQVGEADAVRSRRILDAGDGVPEEFQGAIDRDFDPEQGYSRCPACRAALAPGLAACRDCGLELGGGGSDGESCDAHHVDGSCPQCGPPRPRR